MTDDRTPRPYDIVLFGATGFTGRLVALELARCANDQAPDSDARTQWALAGRDRRKLEALRESLAREEPSCATLPILIADSNDPQQLAAIARATRVVCTTVGPYSLLGEPLVAACAEHGTDYCDLTGEVPFMRRSIDRYHQLAIERGARIVHACGFDSIPSDLGTFALQREAVGRFGHPATRVRFTLKKLRGGFSGGTIASVLHMVEQLQKDPGLGKVIGHAYALNPDGERAGPDRGDPLRPARDPATGRWWGPFLMGPVNTRVVRRSHALAGYPWGRQFRYDEVMDCGPGTRGLLKASSMSLGLVAFLGALWVPPLKRLLRTRLPAPGEGPSEAMIRDGFFKAELTGVMGPGGEDAGSVVKLEVSGRGDPGYGATARMLTQAALCLAHDPPSGSLSAGVLTPSTAMGEALLKRLARVDVTFTPA